MNTKKLIKEVETECAKFGVRFRIGNGSYVCASPSVRCNGYFSTSTDELVVARKIKNFSWTLAHEYCHFQQWSTNSKIWKKYENSDAWWLINDALQKKQVEQRKLEKSSRLLMTVERDCERRAVELLKRYNETPANIDKYIQKANAYTLFYLHIAENKKWYKIGKEPYNVKKVWQHFPKSLDIDVEECYKNNKHLFKFCV